MAHLEVALAGTVARRPVVLDLHDLVEEGLGRRVLRLAARLATVSLANSSATAQTVGGESSKVRVVHPGVDTDRFFPTAADPAIRAQLSARPEAPLVGILGRIDPNKGVQTLVEAMARPDANLGRANLSRAHLVVIGREHVGSADFAAELRRRADELLGDRVRFIGPRDDVPDVLRALDIMINASRHEPFGRTVLEKPRRAALPSWRPMLRGASRSSSRTSGPACWFRRWTRRPWGLPSSDSSVTRRCVVAWRARALAREPAPGARHGVESLGDDVGRTDALPVQ